MSSLTACRPGWPGPAPCLGGLHLVTTKRANPFARHGSRNPRDKARAAANRGGMRMTQIPLGAIAARPHLSNWPEISYDYADPLDLCQPCPAQLGRIPPPAAPSPWPDAYANPLRRVGGRRHRAPTGWGPGSRSGRSGPAWLMRLDSTPRPGENRVVSSVGLPDEGQVPCTSIFGKGGSAPWSQASRWCGLPG